LPSADLWPASSVDVEPVLTGEAHPPALPAAVASAPASPGANRVAAADPSRPVSWAAVGAYLYLLGLLASLVYVAAGWLAMTANRNWRSRQVALPDGALVYESAIIAAPLTAGVFKPRIVLAGELARLAGAHASGGRRA